MSDDRKAGLIVAGVMLAILAAAAASVWLGGVAINLILGGG